MRFDEQTAKGFLAECGFRVPRGRAVTSEEEALEAARALDGPVVVKALTAHGGRGKAGLVRFAASADDAREAARALLARSGIESLRVEERVDIAQELYAAVVTDRSLKCPLLLFSTEGGIEIESSGQIARHPIDIRRGIDPEQLRRWLRLDHALFNDVEWFLMTLYDLYRKLDAELFEINPLGVTPTGELIALDAKLIVDDAAIGRHLELPEIERTETVLERRAREAGLYYLELEGNVGVLANGAGLTMATLDAVRHYGGQPANFMEIGGDAYRKATEALGIVLGNPRVTTLLVNLCGAYARTDVMIEGFLTGWKTLRPSVPVCFSIRGTGETRARQLVADELGVEPFESMDEAVQAAIRHG